MFESLYNIYRNRTNLSDDNLPYELKNIFQVDISINELTHRVRVRITSHSVQFIYIKDTDEKQGGYGAVVDSISITSPKETGRDLLGFGKHIAIPDDLSSDINSGYGILPKTSAEIFYNFPGVNNILDKEKQNELYKEDEFSYFLKVCLLSFLFEFEIRESVFGISPLYDEVRNKLRTSKVYQLLCAKVKYDMLLYKWRNGGMHALDKEEYDYIVHCYADLLMDNEYNKIVPPEYFDGKGWLYDPETELEGIVEDNRKLIRHLRKSGGTSKDADFKTELKDKIRNYFYTKHAVWRAQLSIREKCSFGIAQGFMLAFTLLSGVAMLFYKEPCLVCFTNWYFTNFFWVAVVTSILVFILLVINWGISQSPNVFLPRIIVSVTIMWLMTFISEDLIKSQILIDRVGILTILAIVLFAIVFVLLYGEIKQHSPYTAIRYFDRWIGKSFCILNYFIFVVGIFGMIMQLFFYKDLLKGSQALPEIVYESDYYQPLEEYKADLGYLQKSIADYREFSMYFSSHIKPIETRSTQRVSSADSSFAIEFVENRKTRSAVQFERPQTNYYKIVDEFNENVNRIVAIRDSIGISFPEVNISRCNLVLRNLSDSTAIAKDSSLLKKNDTIANGWYRWLRNEQCKVDAAIQMNDYDTLLRWATYLSDTITKPQDYVGCLKNKAMQSHNVCRDVGKSDNPPKIFPHLLLIHSLIVLILAFIGQLFLTKETVSEPL